MYKKEWVIKKLIMGFIFTYILIFATVCLEAKMDSVLGNSGITKVENVHDSNGKITLSADELTNLKNTTDEHEKNFDRILSCQQFVYTHSITVLLGLFFFFVGLNFLWNIVGAKKFAVSRTNQMAKSLREEFAENTKEMTEKMSEEYGQKFKKLEDVHSLAFMRLEGDNYNALGRIYGRTDSPVVACLWFARGLQKHFKADVDEKWMKAQFLLTKISLEKCAFDDKDKERIEELKQIFSEITDEKFKTEKEGLEKILQAKIEEMEAKKKETKVI